MKNRCKTSAGSPHLIPPYDHPGHYNFSIAASRMITGRLRTAPGIMTPSNVPNACTIHKSRFAAPCNGGPIQPWAELEPLAMPNGVRWRENIDKRNVASLGEYMSRRKWSEGLEIPLSTFFDDTDWEKAPTSEWYALHFITRRDDKWSSRIFAWGLNMTDMDLEAIEDEILSLCNDIHVHSNPAVADEPDTQWTATESRRVLYLLEKCFDRFEHLCVGLRPLFPAVDVPRYWQMSAAIAFISRCWSSAEKGRGEPGAAPLALAEAPSGQSRPFANDTKSENQPPSWRTRWNYDCMSKVFAWSGLRKNTMRAIARSLGFNQVEIDGLVRLRCNPLPLLGELVAKPKELLDMMHDCDVILSGAHAVGFFWPSVCLPTSDWVFRTHPHVLHWLKFAVYLSSVGVEWKLPVDGGRRTGDDEDGMAEMERYQYCPSSGQIIHGITKRCGRTHHVQLIAHSEYPRQESSIQDLLTEHASMSQCFIAGFGAACMYAQPTTSGRSFVWSTGDEEDDSTWEDVQLEVDEYKRKGVEFDLSDSHMALKPGQIPKPAKRNLADSRSLRISFEEHVSKTRRNQAQLDFDLLRSITWLENCHDLGHVQYAENSFWNNQLEDMWAERSICKEDNLCQVVVFEMLLERLACPDCRLPERSFCRIHTLPRTERMAAELLFFCLEKIERRRMSWSFLQLPFEWKDCWEYPYI